MMRKVKVKPRQKRSTFALTKLFFKSENISGVVPVAAVSDIVWIANVQTTD